MNKKQKRQLIRIILAVVLVAGALFSEMLVGIPKTLTTVLYFAAYITVGLETVQKSSQKYFSRPSL